jgi:hypothetical protein
MGSSRKTYQRPDQTQPIRNPPCVGKFFGGPLTGSPVESPPTLNHVVECADNLLHGGEAVGAVSVNQVDILEAQTVQRGSHTFDHMLSRKTNRVLRAGLVRTVRSPEVDLGADDDIAALPAKLSNGFSHYDLGLTLAIALGGVEETENLLVNAQLSMQEWYNVLDSMIVRSFEDLERFLVVDMSSEGEPAQKELLTLLNCKEEINRNIPAAQRDRGDLEAGAAELAVLHGGEGCFNCIGGHIFSGGLF